MAGKYGQKTSAAPPKAKSESIVAEANPMNHMEVQILKWLQSVKFRKATFGGVEEADLWKKLGELYDLFHQAISAERARYEGLLQTYAKSTTEKIANLEKQNEALRQQYQDLYQAYLEQRSGLKPMQGGE